MMHGTTLCLGSSNHQPHCAICRKFYNDYIFRLYDNPTTSFFFCEDCSDQVTISRWIERVYILEWLEPELPQERLI